MGHEHDRAPLPLELTYPVEALALEVLVPHGEYLVDQEHVGVHVHRHREPQPHVHARRVVLDLVVDELLKLGEGHDGVEPALDLLARKPQQRRVQEDVVPAAQLGLEAGAQLEQGRQPAPHLDGAGGRLEDAGDALEQGGLARAVVAQEPHRLALADLHVDVTQGPEVLMGDAPQVDEPLLERRVLLVVQAEALGDLRHLDGDRGGGDGHRAQSSSAKLPSTLANTATAPRKRSTDPPMTPSSWARYHRRPAWAGRMATGPLPVVLGGLILL